jgi:hypothetical protein
MRISRGGCVDDSRSCPTIHAWFVSSPSVDIIERLTQAAPDDHFATTPDSGVGLSAFWGVCRAGADPVIRHGIVSPAGVEKGGAGCSTPDHHFVACPNGSVIVSSIRCVDRTGSCPGIRNGAISSSSIHRITIISPPDDHFAAAPHCCVSISGGRCAASASSGPAISAWIISTSSV